MGLRENDFEAVRKTGLGTLRPGNCALGSECGNTVRDFYGTRGHYAASFALALTGVRKTMARFSFRRYFWATDWISSRVTARNPSRMVFTSCGWLSNSVKQARRCINPYFGI